MACQFSLLSVCFKIGTFAVSNLMVQPINSGSRWVGDECFFMNPSEDPFLLRNKVSDSALV